jgi:hypothetical protein
MPLSHMRPAVYGGLRRCGRVICARRPIHGPLRNARRLRHRPLAKAKTKRPINGPKIRWFWVRRSPGPAVNGGSKTRKGHECPSTLARPRNFIERERGRAAVALRARSAHGLAGSASQNTPTSGFGWCRWYRFRTSAVIHTQRVLRFSTGGTPVAPKSRAAQHWKSIKNYARFID